jgi:hypothetical protein
MVIIGSTKDRSRTALNNFKIRNTMNYVPSGNRTQLEIKKNGRPFSGAFVVLNLTTTQAETEAYVRDREEPTPVVDQTLFINFADYAVAPISHKHASNPAAKIQLQPNQIWSGGDQVNFTNDNPSPPNTETITTAPALSEGKSWYTGKHLYGQPQDGSPFTPRLPIEISSANEAAFNSNMIGATLKYSLYFRSQASAADNAQLRVYNGSYLGNDRTGFNINVKNESGGSTVFSFTYDAANNTYPTTNIATNLNFQNWHKVEVIMTLTDADPANNIYKYSVNGGSQVTVNSWPNLYRKKEGKTLVYGTRVAFAVHNGSLGAAQSGWYVDNISMEYMGK